MQQREYQHEPQHYRVLEELKSARFHLDGAGQEEQHSAQLPVGVQHGARVRFVAEEVMVDGGKHYFCPSRDYRVLEILERGDGNPLRSNTPCHVDVEMIPDADGTYRFVGEVVNNNGTLLVAQLAWLDHNGKEVTNLRKDAGLLV